MPVIVSASHAWPPNAVSQDFLKAAVRRIFAGRMPEPDLRRIEDVFDHSRIRSRAFMMPLDWYLAPRTAEERNRVFVEKGLGLLLRAAGESLAAARCAPESVDHLIFATTTGFSTPSLDSHLINGLGMRPDTTRLPMWGLGCAAGASAIARAFDYCLAHPSGIALVTALETCSLNFMPDDMSRKNLVAMSLFADCCAAVVVAGDEAPAAQPGCPRIVGTRSRLFPGSAGIAGWDVTDRGFRLVLAPDLPDFIRRELPGLLDELLGPYGLKRGDLSHFILHPGGARIMDAMADALGLANGELRYSEEVLRDFGNVSSVSVLLVLERWMADGGCRMAGNGLVASFGPGFSSEMALVRN